jgi:hypothetical protein
MFEKFASLTRFSHGWAITEKLDGTNACVLIAPTTERGTEEQQRHRLGYDRESGLGIFAQSRNNLLSLDKDNAGFAQFVHQSQKALIAMLGEGRHYGEWVGKGINKRQYGLPDKRFALFNTARWTGADLPDRVTVVPVLAEGYMGEPGAEFARIMDDLKANGSRFAPGFMDPEGIVMRHGPSGTLFKKTFDYDEQGKWAENQARKEQQA